ncbi:uncharacterized protein Z520_04743 [Fonsecaea multimorphosa CBS 102226]|uniref:Uncharacterized protein n=1 Tax=Fonsecaea multimorphosa CBS 102226 TaxID=1442371 RepID=A0A0D2K039_9EURO|nr:uncharacterized protein Z520_04743 [Fonsecaea multimorphosa CBS 102226]KIX99167.1 hypothetical protein Z520_04743 [Fonsecaea multimorphosa CBS 102226]
MKTLTPLSMSTLKPLSMKTLTPLPMRTSTLEEPDIATVEEICSYSASDDLFVVRNNIPGFRNTFTESHNILTKIERKISASTSGILQRRGPLDFLSKVPVLVDPSLPSVLEAKRPPSWEWFQVLPNTLHLPIDMLKTHALIYAVPGSTEHCRFLYVGSTYSPSRGCFLRMGCYDRFIEALKAFLEGFITKEQLYHVTQCTSLGTNIRRTVAEGGIFKRVAVLAMIPMGKTSDFSVAQISAYVKFLEAMFHTRLWSFHQSSDANENHYLKPACPWKLKEFDYRGLNSHSPLMERTKGLEAELPASEFEKFCAMRMEALRQTSLAKARLITQVRDAMREAKSTSSEAPYKALAKALGVPHSHIQVLVSRIRTNDAKMTEKGRRISALRRGIETGEFNRESLKPSDRLLVDKRESQLSHERKSRAKLQAVKDGEVELDSLDASVLTHVNKYEKQLESSRIATKVMNGEIELAQVDPILRGRVEGHMVKRKAEEDKGKARRKLERDAKQEAAVKEFLSFTAYSGINKQKWGRVINIEIQEGRWIEADLNPKTREIYRYYKDREGKQRATDRKRSRKISAGNQLVKAVKSGQRDKDEFTAEEQDQYETALKAAVTQKKSNEKKKKNRAAQKKAAQQKAAQQKKAAPKKKSHAK